MSTTQPKTPPSPKLDFTVVGIGASAGGLEALQEVFTHLTEAQNMAFFVVQHLSPDFKSMVVEILQRHTRLQVLDAQDRALVEPGNVYVLPPRKDVRLEGRRIALADRIRGAGLHLPIDEFLESLARSQHARSVAVILSGTGTDGSRGITHIKSHGGIVMAQDPTTSKFDGMPRSAIATGTVDYVLSPAALAQRLLELQAPNSSVIAREETEPFLHILSLVAKKSGVDLTAYKEGTLHRRIERRTTLLKVPSLAAYALLLEEDEDELHTLSMDLLIGVTRFFRDPEAWAWLEKEVFPSLVDKQELRLWSVGCSTGPEAYSLAIALLETIEAHEVEAPLLRVFATDASSDAIHTAAKGEYSETELFGLPLGLREKYFEPHEGCWRVRKFLRDKITFAIHNVMTDPPFTRLDLVTCRNLLIYLQPEGQRIALARLHFGLQEGGILVLGPSETAGEQKHYFHPLHLKWKVYRATGRSADLTHSLGTIRISPSLARARAPLAQEIHVLTALDHFVPPGIAVNEAFEVIHLFGDVSAYLKLPPGRPTLVLTELLPPAVSVLLNGAARRVRSTGASIRIPNLELHERPISILVLPVGQRNTNRNLLVFFLEARPREESSELDAPELSAESMNQLSELRDELLLTRENLRTAVEDLEATNEELQATNEELIASNEELQSTNEELQSVNEELFTVNTEHQEKIEELVYLNRDLENLLRAIEIGTLFLDEDLRVRRFNQTVLRLIALREEDTGRALDDLRLRADYPGFYSRVRQVLEDRQPVEEQISGPDGTVWSVYIRPLEERLHSTAGVIVMFRDLTAWRTQELRLGELAAFEMAAGLAGVGVVLVDLAVRQVNPSDTARELLGLSSEEDLSYEAMQELLTGDSATEHGGNVLPTDALRHHTQPNGTAIALRVFALRLHHEASGTSQLLVALQQVWT